MIGVPESGSQDRTNEAEDIEDEFEDEIEDCVEGEELVFLRGRHSCKPACQDGFVGVGNHCYEEGCPEGMKDEKTHCLKPESYKRDKHETKCDECVEVNGEYYKKCNSGYYGNGADCIFMCPNESGLIDLDD